VAWPEPDHEHRHDDREIRVVLEGRLRCLLRTPGGHAAIVLEPGEWLALPRQLLHWPVVHPPLALALAA
jgi:cupin superfamily acireductone dioxygenase involved in methionine salvage